MATAGLAHYITQSFYDNFPSHIAQHTEQRISLAPFVEDHIDEHAKNVKVYHEVFRQDGKLQNGDSAVGVEPYMYGTMSDKSRAGQVLKTDPPLHVEPTLQTEQERPSRSLLFRNLNEKMSELEDLQQKMKCKFKRDRSAVSNLQNTESVNFSVLPVAAAKSSAYLEDAECNTEPWAFARDLQDMHRHVSHEQIPTSAQNEVNYSSSYHSAGNTQETVLDDFSISDVFEMKVASSEACGLPRHRHTLQSHLGNAQFSEDHRQCYQDSQTTQKVYLFSKPDDSLSDVHITEHSLNSHTCPPSKLSPGPSDSSPEVHHSLDSQTCQTPKMFQEVESLNSQSQHDSKPLPQHDSSTWHHSINSLASKSPNTSPEVYHSLDCQTIQDSKMPPQPDTFPTWYHFIDSQASKSKTFTKVLHSFDSRMEHDPRLLPQHDISPTGHHSIDSQASKSPNVSEVLHSLDPQTHQNFQQSQQSPATFPEIHQSLKSQTCQESELSPQPLDVPPVHFSDKTVEVEREELDISVEALDMRSGMEENKEHSDEPCSPLMQQPVDGSQQQDVLADLLTVDKKIDVQKFLPSADEVSVRLSPLSQVSEKRLDLMTETLDPDIADMGREAFENAIMDGDSGLATDRKDNADLDSSMSYSSDSDIIHILTHIQDLQPANTDEILSEKTVLQSPKSQQPTKNIDSEGHISEPLKNHEEDTSQVFDSFHDILNEGNNYAFPSLHSVRQKQNTQKELEENLLKDTTMLSKSDDVMQAYNQAAEMSITTSEHISQNQASSSNSSTPTTKHSAGDHASGNYAKTCKTGRQGSQTAEMQTYIKQSDKDSTDVSQGAEMASAEQQKKHVPLYRRASQLTNTCDAEANKTNDMIFKTAKETLNDSRPQLIGNSSHDLYYPSDTEAKSQEKSYPPLRVIIREVDTGRQVHVNIQTLEEVAGGHSAGEIHVGCADHPIPCQPCNKENRDEQERSTGKYLLLADGFQALLQFSLIYFVP